MEFFKREMRGKDDKGKGKLVGVEIPTSTFNYLNLFCVVDSCSKSSIIRPLIEDWAEGALATYSEKKLIEMAANMGFISWKNRNNKRISFNNVLKVQRRELERKGISDKVIDKIIKKIEDAKNKED